MKIGNAMVSTMEQDSACSMMSAAGIGRFGRCDRTREQRRAKRRPISDR